MPATGFCACGARTPLRRGNRGQHPKWCSETCRVRSYKVRAPRTQRACPCGADITSEWPTRRYCSTRCRDAARRAKPTEQYRCGDCGAEFTRQPTKGQRPKWCDACRHRRGHPAPVRPSVRAEVYMRDGGTCGICLEPVDMAADARTDWAPTLDHITPRSQGGTDAIDNLRLAHHWCNSVRSDGRRYADDDLREIA